MLIGTLPPGLSTAMLVETHRHGDYTGLKLFVKEHIQIITDQIERVKGTGGRPVNAIGEGSDALGSVYSRGRRRVKTAVLDPLEGASTATLSTRRATCCRNRSSRSTP